MEVHHMWGLARWDEEVGLSVLSEPFITGAMVLDYQKEDRFSRISKDTCAFGNQGSGFKVRGSGVRGQVRIQD